MQFVYIDESGTGEEPIAVMVGVVVDSHRMRPTKEEWKALLTILSGIVGQEITEIHTRDFYSGNSPWRELGGHQRSSIIDAVFQWLRVRKHAIVYTAVDKVAFQNGILNEPYYRDIRTLWRFMALHLSLSIQKYYQGSPRGNNRTINLTGQCALVCDNENREMKRFTDLLSSAPDWTDTYYDRKPSQLRFSQIVDVPYFVDSRDVALIQLADFICFFLRRHLELSMSYSEPAYRDEAEKVGRWAAMILERAIPRCNSYLSRGRCSCADLFYRYAPTTIQLHRPPYN